MVAKIWGTFSGCLYDLGLHTWKLGIGVSRTSDKGRYAIRVMHNAGSVDEI